MPEWAPVDRQSSWMEGPAALSWRFGRTHYARITLQSRCRCVVPRNTYPHSPCACRRVSPRIEAARDTNPSRGLGRAEQCSPALALDRSDARRIGTLQVSAALQNLERVLLVSQPERLGLPEA